MMRAERAKSAKFADGMEISLKSLKQHGQWIFDQLFEGGEQLRADRAVDNPVIAGERAAHHRRDCERAVFNDRSLLAGADCEDAAMRRVDDRGEVADPEHAEVRDRKSPALEFLQLQFAQPGASGEVLGLV